jgi:hypothetical protein
MQTVKEMNAMNAADSCVTIYWGPAPGSGTVA